MTGGPTANDEALRLHAVYRGKMQRLPRCPVLGFADFALWYTPGVTAPCRAIQGDPELAWIHTGKAATIAALSGRRRRAGPAPRRAPPPPRGGRSGPARR